MSLLVYPRGAAPASAFIRGISWNITRRPNWDTLVQDSAQGRSFAHGYWTNPLWEWEIEYNYLKDNPSSLPTGYTGTDLATLQGFFNQMNGQWGVFLFDDVNAGETPGAGLWDSVTMAPAINTTTNGILGDGTTTLWQLARESGQTPFAAPFYEYIQTPFMADGSSTNPNVYVGGVLQSYGTQYSINSIGQILFLTAPGNAVPVTWTGGYYWPVRFGTDDLEFDRQLYQLWKIKKVTLQQVRL